ncbi:hypothetical protein SEA_CHEETO1_14 [Microbacterium phage Cheeto1]|nr:hypothetical protein SEA_CHEETO1_14 [Microbacterium phage Cheeto1]
MAKGIVVEHKGNGMQYAVSESNFNEKVHKKVRDLKPGESVRDYKPRPKKALSEAVGHTKTEGSSVDTKDAKKEGN